MIDVENCVQELTRQFFYDNMVVGVIGMGCGRIILHASSLVFDSFDFTLGPVYCGWITMDWQIVGRWADLFDIILSDDGRIRGTCVLVQNQIRGGVLFLLAWPKFSAPTPSVHYEPLSHSALTNAARIWTFYSILIDRNSSSPCISAPFHSFNQACD